MEATNPAEVNLTMMVNCKGETDEFVNECIWDLTQQVGPGFATYYNSRSLGGGFYDFDLGFIIHRDDVLSRRKGVKPYKTIKNLFMQCAAIAQNPPSLGLMIEYPEYPMPLKFNHQMPLPRLSDALDAVIPLLKSIPRLGGIIDYAQYNEMTCAWEVVNYEIKEDDFINETVLSN